jgi:ATP-dependent 26S proteasome regulatory subunit
MKKMAWIDRLEALIQSFCSLFYVGTPNHGLIFNACLGLADKHDLDVYAYNISKGMWRPDHPEATPKAMDPIEMVNWILDQRMKGPFTKRRILFLEHFGVLLENGDPLLMTKLRLIHDQTSYRNSVVIIGNANLVLPDGLSEIPRVDASVLTKQEIHHALIASGVPLSKRRMGALTSSLMGLTEKELENVLALSLVKKKGFDPGFIEKEKALLVSQRVKGMIQICRAQWTLGDVGGLDLLKTWLLRRTQLIRGNVSRQFRKLPAPKGILLTGPPGCGKSFVSEALAGSWKVQLIKLDPARCLHSLVGRTEQNFLTALEIIHKALRPCVVLLEEFEKFFPGDTGHASDGGVSSRVLGIMLDFLQSRREGVFVCATTNGVQALAPEIMRALRFDACWFVDLPKRTERKAIFGLIFAKYGLKNIAPLSEKILDATEDFSAAEIEQTVIEAMVLCVEPHTDFNEFMLLKAVNEIVPLAHARKEEVSRMRNWAVGRARMASSSNMENHHERSRICPISQR